MTITPYPKIALFDTHAHLDLIDCYQNKQSYDQTPHYDQFLPVVKTHGDFPGSHDFQMVGIVWPGITPQSSCQALDFSRKCEIIFPSVGIHPNSTGKVSPNDWSEIVELAKSPQVAAIGETGLDRYWDTVPFEIQIQYFELHLDLAKDRRLPILVHSRDCDDDMLAILGNMAKVSPVFGVIHSFSSTSAVAEQYLDMGLYISFSGAVTYTNKKFAALHEAAKMVPEDRLLIETDSPFLTPHPYRGKLNENVPIMTAFVAKALATLRGTTIEHIAAVTSANAQRIFKKIRKN